MSFWDTLLAVNPELLWDDVGGVAEDLSPNGRDGAYVNTPTLGEPSIIPALPTAKSVRLTKAQSEYITRAHEAWMNGTEFTLLLWYKAPAVLAHGELLGHMDCSQLWLRSNGMLQMYTFEDGVGWQQLDSAVGVIAADGFYMIAYTNGPAGRNVVVNGVSVAFNATRKNPRALNQPFQVGRTSVGSGEYLDGWVQAPMWVASQLSTATLNAIYDESQIVPNELDPGINFMDSGVVDDIVHDAASLPPRDPFEDQVMAHETDLVPDVTKWTPDGALPDRWREGYGFFTPFPGGYALSQRTDVKRLRAYGGDLWDPDTATYIEEPDPEVTVENMMFLQHAHTAALVAGIFSAKRGIVCLWRDPVSGNALLLNTSYPASLKFYDAGSNSLSANINGTIYFADGSTLAGHVPIKGSFGGDADEDIVEVGFSVTSTGLVTLYFPENEFTVDLSYGNAVRWVGPDLSAFINDPGGVAYALDTPHLVSEHRALRVTAADYIEVTGLQEGWIVRAGQRYYESWLSFDADEPWNTELPPPTRNAEAVRFAVIEAVADADGVARLYPSNRAFTRIHDRMAEWDDLTGIDASITPPDAWVFDYIAVLIDEETEADRYEAPLGVFIGDEFAWEHMDLPAYAPVAFVSPLVDEIVGAANPYNVEVTPHAPAHPEAETVKYQWEYSADGETWVLAQDWQAAADFDWDHSALAFSRTAQLRVRARGDVSLIESGWLVSDVFVLYHGSADIDVDDAAPGEYVAAVTQYSVKLQPLESPEGHKSTRWKLYDEGVLVLDITATGDERMGKWITGLEEAHRYEVEYAIIDYNDVTGSYSYRRYFWTLRLTEFAPHAAVEVFGNAEGDYRNAEGGFIDGVDTGLPELLGGGGARLNMFGLNFEQTPAEFPNQTHHMIRFEAIEVTGFRGSMTHHREGFTCMLVCTPHDLSSERELLGQVGDFFLWHTAEGELVATVVATIDHDFHVLLYGDGETEYESGNANFPSGQFLREEEMQAVFFGGQNAWYGTQLAVLMPSGTPVEIRVPAAPEEEVQSLEVYLGINGLFEKQPILGLFNGAIPTTDKFKVDPTRVMQLDVGHGSSNADAAGDVQADGRFARMIVHGIVWWQDLLPQEEARVLGTFVEEGNIAALWKYIEDMEPQPWAVCKVVEYPKPDKPTVTVP